MFTPLTRINGQVRKTCEITGARWAVWLYPDRLSTHVSPAAGLDRVGAEAVKDLLEQPAAKDWLQDVLQGKTPGSYPVSGKIAMLGCSRVYGFKNQAGEADPRGSAPVALLVGAEELSLEACRFFELLAKDTGWGEFKGALPAIAGSPLEPENLKSEFYYSPEALYQLVLDELAEAAGCDQAYLAVRLANEFRVQALRGEPHYKIGEEVRPENSPCLTELLQRQAPLFIKCRGETCKEVNLSNPEHSCLLLPIRIGQRMIGYVHTYMGSSVEMELQQIEQVQMYADRLAHAVEMAIVFMDVSRYLQQFSLLNELASAASTGTGPDEVSLKVIERLRLTFGTPYVHIYMLSEDGQELHEYGVGDGRMPQVFQVRSSLMGQVVETGLPVRLDDVHQVPRFQPRIGAVRSLLDVPLKYQGRVIGVISVQSTSLATFSNSDEKLLVVVATHLAGILENTRRAQDVENSLAKLQAVYETGLDITADLSQEALFRRVLKRVTELTRTRAALVALHDKQARKLIVAGSSGFWGSSSPIHWIPDDIGLMGQVIASGRPAVVLNYQDWARRIASEITQQTTAAACAPLTLKDQVLGCLMVIDDKPGRKFGRAEINILELLAAQLAVALHNTRLYHEMQEHIAAQHRAEVNLIRSARLAAVGEMAAGVAHEINNPLAAISGFVELALRELPTGLPQVEDLKIALAEAHRASDVVKRLLDFSRQVDPEVEPANLNAIVQETLPLLQHAAETDRIHLYTELAEELPDVMIERNQIKQVILNLAKNAIAAMPQGGDLRLKTSVETYKGQRGLALFVEDTGEGILSENLARIFDPFFTTRPPGLGTGLGLSVTYAIVENHGGRIDVQSKPNSGSSFKVWLPLALEQKNA